MGLLAPLYALAALAIVGPLFFHLIRRQPQGQTQFSSLMFLQPSPPRLTRRSRLDNLLLLFLRVLAIGLIAAAFARPYLRKESLLSTRLEGRNIVLLLDTSASMQRPGVWQDAQAEVSKVLDTLAADDRVSLYTISDSVHAIVPFDAERSTDGVATQQALRLAVAEIKPTWLKTELADGLQEVADLLSAATIAGKLSASEVREVVLISDLHTDCGLESLQGYPWPEKVRLDVRRVLPNDPGNARASMMVTGDDTTEEGYRVRVENNLDSPQQSFELVWANSQGPLSGATTRVQVPSGQVRVLPMPSRPTGADRISLLGDAWGDDNDVFILETSPAIQKIAFLGTEQDRAEESLGYFLEKAPLSTPLVRREVVPVRVEGLPEVLEDEQTRSIVLELQTGIVPYVSLLRSFAEEGGTVVVCLARPLGDLEMQSRVLQELWDADDVSVAEATSDEFALLGAIDYRNPVFAPFADPRFNDFSKLRFWTHRVVSIPENKSLNVVTEFDDESPMLVQQPVGAGSFWVFTTGWQPSASGLGLSSKFIPILMGIMDPTGKTRKADLSFAVGEEIPRTSSAELRVIDALGEEVENSLADISSDFVRILRPGLYGLESDGGRQEVAIQIPASESQSVPLDVDVFEQYGIGVGTLATDTERQETARQLQVEELERQQRLWQWLIAAGIVVLAIETFLAGRTARLNARQLVTA